MMRIILLFILLLAFPASNFAQSKKKIVRYGISECIETKTFLKNGEKVHEFVSEKKQWDKHGNLILNEQFSKDGSIELRESFVWKDKQLIEEKVEKQISEKKGKTKFTHSKSTYKGDLKQEEQYFNENGEITHRLVFTYNRFGDKIEEKEFSTSGDLLKTTTFSYDNKGLKIEKAETEKTINGTNTEITVYTYSFR